MPVVAWRFQADLRPGVVDPEVTVFVSVSHTNDVTGDIIVPQDTANPVTVKLSGLPEFLASPYLGKPPTPPPTPKVPE